MSGEIIIQPMTENFILWRCLHSGPLTCRNIDLWPSDIPLDWQKYRARNIPLLTKLTLTYGACAILAHDDDRVVGHLRFYPKIIWDMSEAGEMCLQQDYPNGPMENFAEMDFPSLEKIEDKTIAVHCFMTGSSQQADNPFQRKGIGTRLVRFLIDWARAKGWEGIEVDAFEDLPLIYEITGSAGHSFWQKQGFHIVDRHPHPHLQGRDEFVVKLEEQAESAGIPLENAKDRIVMRIELTGSS